jgi:ADP-ribosylglycohydrolase
MAAEKIAFSSAAKYTLTPMLGAILGDVVGSVHEYSGTKTKRFPLFVSRSTFTDDSVLTVAVAEWILTREDLGGLLSAYTKKFPGRGYGSMFSAWASAPERHPYGSYGNGSAMRVSPVGFAFETLDEVLDWAEQSAAVTHNHSEGVRGAQATAAAIFLARHGRDKAQIKQAIETQFGYDLSASLDEIRPTYQFTELCRQTVPPALVAFLESTDYEDAIRNAISLGGDADTLACITGGVAEAFYGGVPTHLAAHVRSLLDPRLLDVIDRFRARSSLP